MLSIQGPEVKTRIASWESELRSMTGDDTVKLLPAGLPEQNLTLEEIAEIVMHVTGVEYTKLVGKSRKRHIILARHLVCYYGYKRHVFSWKDVGVYLGNRDHTTAMAGKASIQDLLDAGDLATVNAVSQVSTYLEEVKKRKGRKKN